MAAQWKSYFCNVNDKLASIALDLGLRPDVPIRSKPWLLWVWVYMKSPKPNGLSDQGEFGVLSSIEDELANQLGFASAVEAGRITTDGRREMYFYGKHSDGFEVAVKSVMKNFKGYKFDLGTQEDPEWNQYLDVLYPSEENMQCMRNQDVLNVLTEQGDTLTPVRDVHHWIYFQSRTDREWYASEVRELGYRIENETEKTGEERPFGLVITRDQSVTPDEIDEATIELLRLAKQVGAEYDGWETQLIVTKN